MKLTRSRSRHTQRLLICTFTLALAIGLSASPSFAAPPSEQATIELGTDDLGKSREELGDRSLPTDDVRTGEAEATNEERKGKPGKCGKCGKDGKREQCPLGKKGECKGKGGECPMKKAGGCKGKHRDCPLAKDGECKGKGGQCPMKKAGGCCGSKGKCDKKQMKGKRMSYQKCLDASILAGNSRDESARVCRAAFPSDS